MTDPSKRPLTFPKWHIPYLEKHRIPELFHEIARELVIQKPEDHILFIKQIIQKAASNRDVNRLILIGSQKINRLGLAQDIASTTHQIIISLEDINNLFPINDDPSSIARAIAFMVRNPNISNLGWIIADCINTEEEAKQLLKLGILPTHVIYLVAPFQLNLNDLLYCDVPENWAELRRNLFGLKEVFNKKLRQVHLTDKNLNGVAKDCIAILSKRVAHKSGKPRVVILGPRGSGRKSQANLLNDYLGIIHIDFEYLLCQAWTSDSDLGSQLRMCNKDVCMHSELLCQIVNKRILEKDCLEKGWVITGYPFTVPDFQFLDSLQTPPNRVILLECDLNIAKDRIRNRLINAYTGSCNNLTDQSTTTKLLYSHPKDAIQLIQAEHNFYCENYGSIKKYCGNTMMMVNGEQHQRWVYECILGHLVGGSPVGPPRKGFGNEIPEVCSCDCINIPTNVAKTYNILI